MDDFGTILKQAEQGDAQAQFRAGNCFQQGLLGVRPDLPAAIRWYESAAAQGHVDALVNLGIIYISVLPSSGGTKDSAKACTLFKRAAEKGDAQAAFYLGQILLKGDGVPADLALGIAWLERASGAGFAPAQFELGARSLQGKGVEKNPRRAAALFRKAAEQVHAAAQHNLAAMLISGNMGIPQDQAEGLRWLVAAARGGDPDSQYELGQRLRQGQGCDPDLPSALALYKEAASKEHVGAMYTAGLMLAEGKGLDRPRPDLAEQFYQHAAMKGHAGAAHNLAILFAKGLGVGQDLDLAYELMEYAVSLGEDGAMFSAGLALLQMTPPDLVRAAMWAILSINHVPDGPGRKLLDNVLPQMTPSQMEEAKARAASWKREPKTMAWHTYSKGSPDAVVQGQPLP